MTDLPYPIEEIHVAIVGGGPSGLSAAVALRKSGAGRVVVFEREQRAGGIPRHAHHQGYGLRDLHRSLSGPAYAEHWTRQALAHGAEIRTGTQVTGWTNAPGLTFETTAPDGRRAIRAEGVVLATGCRERPRPARLVAGSRPQGVVTTGMLQQLVYLQGEKVGRRAVIVGAEHVSFSALVTLAHGGARPVAMLTGQPRHQSYAVFRAGAWARFRVPLLTRTRVRSIFGRDRVEAIEVEHLDTGVRSTLECDLVVFTGDWIADHELAVLAGAQLDPGTRGPCVDASLRTTVPGLFAVGNVLHGAETADIAALTGRHAATGALTWLGERRWPQERVWITCADPMHWVVPNALTTTDLTAPARGHFLLRARHELLAPEVAVRQDGRELWRGRLPRIMPGRSARLSARWTGEVDGGGSAVEIRVLTARGRPAPR